MPASARPKPATSAISAREWPRRRGRQIRPRTSAATAMRSRTVPPGPTSSKSVFATALPHCTDAIPPSTSSGAGGAGRVRAAVAIHPSVAQEGRRRPSPAASPEVPIPTPAAICEQNPCSVGRRSDQRREGAEGAMGSFTGLRRARSLGVAAIGCAIACAAPGSRPGRTTGQRQPRRRPGRHDPREGQRHDGGVDPREQRAVRDLRGLGGNRLVQRHHAGEGHGDRRRERERRPRCVRRGLPARALAALERGVPAHRHGGQGDDRLPRGQGRDLPDPRVPAVVVGRRGRSTSTCSSRRPPRTCRAGRCRGAASATASTASSTRRTRSPSTCARE